MTLYYDTPIQIEFSQIFATLLANDLHDAIPVVIYENANVELDTENRMYIELSATELEELRNVAKSFRDRRVAYKEKHKDD